MKAAFAAAASPEVRASSNLRRKVRTRERRAVLTSVRRAILRTAFLAPGVLAIRNSSRTDAPDGAGRENRRRGYTGGGAAGQCEAQGFRSLRRRSNCRLFALEVRLPLFDE